MLNIGGMEDQPANIRGKVEKAVNELEFSLSPDNIYYLRFLLGNDFIDSAVVHLFKFIEESDAIVSGSLEPILVQLKVHYDKLKAAEETLLSIQLSDEEIIECVYDFFKRYKMEAIVYPTSIQYSTDYFDKKNIPNWSIIAQLTPPTSHIEREVKLYITAASLDVDLMITN